jgi:hypothetical protein
MPFFIGTLFVIIGIKSIGCILQTLMKISFHAQIGNLAE